MLELVSCLRTAVNVYNSETLNEAASFASMFEGERQEQRCSIVDANQAVVWSSIRKEIKPSVQLRVALRVQAPFEARAPGRNRLHPVGIRAAIAYL